ncbi:MAG: cysteine--tRNA ligase [Candidatus Hodarchaeales archaeon]
MVLKLYNSLTRKKEEFIPFIPDKINVYTCGMTVYDVPHIGHARTYSTWDILLRYLRFLFPDHYILHVQNYTDVGHLTDDADEGEDKILKRAKARKLEPLELVDRYIRVFEDDMRELRVKMPNIAPRATGHISEMIELVQQLLDKNFAYETEKGIYFDVSQFPEYGKMAKIDLEAQKAGARVEVDDLKRNPSDFALFIKAPPSHIMKWPTPWGFIGYPGWHVECSAMAMKYLGETVDIHAGGIDHLTIHHPNERAQSESITGKPFARIWMHANFMTLNGEKMSKSTGNYISASEGIDRVGADLFRYYLVTASHYRTLDDFTFDKLEQKRDEYEKLQTMMAAVESLLRRRETSTMDSYSEEAEKFKKDFIEAMDDDLNTPKAMAVLFSFVTSLNNKLNKTANKLDLLNQLAKDYELFLSLAEILAIRPIPHHEQMDELLEILLDLRNEARKKKNFFEADIIREKILSMGFKVEDKPWGSHVVRLPPHLSQNREKSFKKD